MLFLRSVLTERPTRRTNNLAGARTPRHVIPIRGTPASASAARWHSERRCARNAMTLSMTDPSSRKFDEKNNRHGAKTPEEEK